MTKRAIALAALALAVALGALFAPEITRASEDFRLSLTPDAGMTTSLVVNNAAGVAQISVTAAGVATFTQAPVFSGGVGATTFASIASNGSVTITDADGFNGSTGHALAISVPTVRFDVVAGTTGAQDLLLDTCEAGAAATWTPGGAVAPSDADDAVVFRVGAGSVAVTYGDVGVGNATETAATGGNWDATGDEYIYLWVRSTAALSAGTITVTLDDDTAAPDATVNLPAITAANQWQFVRLDISAVADADKNAVSDLIFTSNHATELDSATVYFDQIVKVDEAESTALAFDAVNQPGGVRSGFSFVEDAGNGTFAALTEWTDFFIADGVNRAYFMTDQSTLNCMLLYATAN